MKKVIPALAIAVCIAAFSLASPQQQQLNTPPDVDESPVSGRFQINTDAWSDPILLDTATCNRMVQGTERSKRRRGNFKCNKVMGKNEFYTEITIDIYVTGSAKKSRPSWNMSGN